MADSLVSVAFHGATLLAVLVNGTPHVSIRSICEALGIDADAQLQRIARHPVLNATTVITTVVAADGKLRDVVAIPLDKLNGWLFGVSSSRVKPELRERLPKMAELSNTWAALIERWAEIEAMQLDEIGLGWTKARSAPKTYALMEQVIDGAKRPNAKLSRQGGADDE